MKLAFLTKTYPPAIHYSIAIVASLAAFFVSELLFPLFLSPVFFLPFVAVMISALCGGWGPGLLSTLLSGASFIYFFLPLTFNPAGNWERESVRLGLFLSFSWLISWVSASFRTAYRAAEAARAEAEEANRFKSRLVSNVSHDLRTPLNAIIGYSDLVLSGTYGPVTEDQGPPLEGVRRNAGDLLKMVNDILDHARIESGRVSMEVGSIEIPLLIREVVEEISPLADQKGLSFHCRLPERLPTIESDGMKIKQILVNLLSNAIKFTERGEVRISVENREEEKGIRIVIQDTGIGIRPEALPNIFDVFYQVEGGEKPKGSGLGLAIVKDLVYLLKGNIEAESEYGKGTTFTLFLPYRFSA
ncbi:MAG: ATP-binding protein [Candidatus Manganitrophus sp. SA1]|nr:ATP-binding protein [Candidatus Manganitrophus morganii]